MRRTTATIAAIALAFGSMMLVSCGSNELIRSDPSGGLNGGFELMEDGYPVNWAFGPDPESTESYRVSVDTERFVEGSNSLCVISSKADPTKAFRSKRVPVQAGAEYRISFSMMNEGCSLRVRRTTMNSSGTKNMREGIIATVSESSSDWVSHEEILTAAQGEAKVFLTFLIDGVGTLWCDDVRIEEHTSE